jgi:hypothetical protein
MPPKRLSNAVRIEVGRRGRSSYRSALVKVNKSRAVLEKEKAQRATLLSCMCNMNVVYNHLTIQW